jgi:hypothetical protein
LALRFMPLANLILLNFQDQPSPKIIYVYHNSRKNNKII